jgi:hypothetical protein
MGRIVVTEYTSIDGVIEAPGGVEDYEHVNWALEFERGEEGQKFKDDETYGSEAQLLGRITYEAFALADDGGRVRRQVQLDAQVRGLSDAGGAELEQHDRASR